MSMLETLGFKDLDVGDAQVVDEMIIVPLISKINLGEIAKPISLKFKRTNDYGSMVYENIDKELDTIIPANMMVRGLDAQDHAMSGSGIVLSKKTIMFNNACCIESSQGGFLKEDQKNEYDILPISLRKNLLPIKIRDKIEYNKLWPNIQSWLKGIGVKYNQAHLRYFYDNIEIKKSLEEFTAEFEPVENQVGAIISFKEKIVGIEIMPTIEYWEQYWKLIIRGCYGAELIRLKKLGKIKSSQLEMPKFPNIKTDINQLLPIIDSFRNNIRDKIIENLEYIKFKHLTSTYKIGDYETILLKTVSNGGGDLIAQKNKSIYLSMVL